MQNGDQCMLTGGQFVQMKVNLCNMKVSVCKMEVSLYKIEVSLYNMEVSLCKMEVSLFNMEGSLGCSIYLMRIEDVMCTSVFYVPSSLA